jgi:tRNA(His) 5'-end guanylyltransferase
VVYLRFKQPYFSLQLLPNAWIVVRIDGKGFHKFSGTGTKTVFDNLIQFFFIKTTFIVIPDQHGFVKPNDKTALGLMNKCAGKNTYSFASRIM